MLTVYGRKAVLEILLDKSLECPALHMAQSNRSSGVIDDITKRASARNIEIKIHSREALSRISKNGKQDQGVAVDVLCPGFQSMENFLSSRGPLDSARILALDGISNPQNLGMIIRSAAAGNIDGIVIAQKGNAALGPLVIKASAGTLFKAPILHCNSLHKALQQCREHGGKVYTLAADAPQSLFEHTADSDNKPGLSIYVLGNETEGVSKEINALADAQLAIPMHNGVESLNVAVTASLIAFATYFEGSSGYLER